MKIRYQQLIGRPVMTADGHSIGRIADLTAAGRSGELRVTGLLVGPAAFIRRIASRHLGIFRAVPPREVPWELVADVGDTVTLRFRRDELDLDTESEAGGRMRVAPRTQRVGPR